MGMFGAITDVPGMKTGHYTDKQAVTGSTVILCEQGATAAEVVAEAIVRAVQKAETLAGVPAAKDVVKC
jgi:L-aminopeptidase/D-esterase-like protein